MRRILRKIGAREVRAGAAPAQVLAVLGDTSTLADPGVVERILAAVAQADAASPAGGRK
jgi:hypothetical protein